MKTKILRERTPMPSQEDLLSVFRYEPQTGEIFWVNPPKFQRKLAGKLAFQKSERSGYKVGDLYGKTFKAHRIIWKMMTGDEPDEVDHIDGNRGNNSWDNLRSVSSQANRRNAALSKNNTSGFIGVRFAKNVQKWTAYITVNYRAINLGLFGTMEEAIAARKAAEIQHGFHANHGRQGTL